MLCEDGQYSKLYRMYDELQVTSNTPMRSYPMLCTAGSEQSHTVLLSNSLTKYRLDLYDLHLVTVQLQSVVEKKSILIVLTSGYIYYILLYTCK